MGWLRIVLRRLFPPRIDNRYGGQKLALWLFFPITLLTISRSLTHIRGDGGARLSRIPLDSFGSDAAQTVIGLFARMGVAQLLLGLVFAVVALRYRAMIPLMYLFIVTEFFASRWVAAAKPLARTGEASVGTFFLALGAVSVVGLLLSLTGKGYSQPIIPDASPA